MGSIGGGGRYDDLTRALGYDRDVPSLGFAYNLDAVIAALGVQNDLGENVALVSPSDAGSVEAAIETARGLRKSGKRAAVNFSRTEGQSA